MKINTVGLLSPGDMGHSVGAVLKANGIQVLTCLTGRSDRTRTLAESSGFENTPNLEELVVRSDLVLSVIVPAQALGVARSVADAIQATSADLLYVDCNAVAPRTVREIELVIQSVGGRFADVGIVGPPPRQPGTKFYTSGSGSPELSRLSAHGLDIRIIGDVAGQASGLKMCYAALTKGLQALGTELLVAAKLMGLEDSLRLEQQDSIPDVLNWLERGLPTMPPKAHRWIGEMEEIATCFADLGLTPDIFSGAAAMYRLVADSPIGQESPELRDTNRDARGVISALAADLAARLQ